MPDAAPLFSIVIPAYNREKFVGAALRSVMAQSCVDWECIVVDDGSRDGTCAAVREFAAQEPRIRLLVQANGGPGAARNTGAAAAKGRYLAFLDSDDLWMPWTLETYREVLRQADWPEYLAGTLRLFAEDAQTADWIKEPLRIAVYKDATAACAHGGVVAGVPMTVVSADVFRRIGGFLEDRLNAEDHDLTLRCGDCRGFAFVAAPVAVAYRQHGDQETAGQAKAMAGMMRLVARERAGDYPGGPARAGERRRIIAAHARPACLTAVRAGEPMAAWRLYKATFFWQLAARRWRFLAGFWLVLLTGRP